jgi:hypothetical protein
MIPSGPRTIDWLESTSRSLASSVPEAAEHASYVTERLGMLLLERLPPELSRELIALLPEEKQLRIPTWIRAELRADRSIGYPAFVSLTRHLLGVTELLDLPQYADSEENYAELCHHVTASFLWAVAQELPIELKQRLAPHLPRDLSARMNLVTGYSGDEKVA